MTDRVDLRRKLEDVERLIERCQRSMKLSNQALARSAATCERGPQQIQHCSELFSEAPSPLSDRRRKPSSEFP
jgi:hypothetical protein